MDKRIATVALALLLVAGVFLAWPTSQSVPGQAGPDVPTAEGTIAAPPPTPEKPITCAIAKEACQACATASCRAQADACDAVAECKAAAEEVGTCLCSAQDASDKAAQGACMATLKTTAALADEAVSCLVSHCAAECAL